MASKTDDKLSVPQGNVFKSEIQPGRNKVALKPGHSLMDWIRLTCSNKDLTGVGGKLLNVTPEELAKHNKKEDAWISLKGKVYNVTPYMEYHPGGEDELMKGVGKDATDLFNEVHRWVNAESMLQKCLVGRLKVPAIYLHKGIFVTGKELVPTVNISSRTTNGINNQIDQNLKVESFSPQKVPYYEWFQSGKSISLIVHTHQTDICHEDVIVDLESKELSITIQIEAYTYQIHLNLEGCIHKTYEVKVTESSDIVEILLLKTDENQWKDLGSPLKSHNSYVHIKEKDIQYRPCKLIAKESITHNTYLFIFSLPDTSTMAVPIGYHVHIRMIVNDIEIVRSYTPVLPDLNIPTNHSVERNKLHLMIKIYCDGALTSLLNEIEVGSVVNISGYEGDFDKKKLKKCRRLILLAAGTGFTPMVKLIHYVLNDTNVERNVQLMFFNRQEKDILWHDHLDKLSKENKCFQVKYVLSEPSEKWTGFSGHIQKSLLENFIPKCEEDVLICVCGPIIFTKTCLQYLEEMELGSSHVHAFMG